MRFIHTSDWHLGRIFHGVHLTDDQDYILRQFVDLVRDNKPDFVVIAGDLYDRAVPPPEAVNLLDDVLSQIVVGLKVPVVMIAGNHDSPERLGFGAKLLQAQGLHVFGPLTGNIKPVVFTDASGPIYVYSVPYAEPSIVRERLEDGTIDNHNKAFQSILGRVRTAIPEKARSVLVTHAFVAGGQESESERPLSVGGSGSVEAAAFAGFNYVALGHLHRPQTAGSPVIQYSGSLLKYSFSEVDHTKSISIVEMDAAGTVSVEKVSLRPRRDLRVISGTLADLLLRAQIDPGKEDYLLIQLEDKGAILDAIGKLRDVHPNVLHIERPALYVPPELQNIKADHRKLNDGQLFTSFFSQVTNEALSEDMTSIYYKVVEELRQKEREAVV